MKYRTNGNVVYMSLSKGDPINETLENFAISQNIGCAWINGIGALENPSLGYYSIDDKFYNKKKFNGIYEIISLIGNISIKEGKPFAHTHISISDSNFRLYGGHLFEAKIAAAGEFILALGINNIIRENNHEVGIPLWCLDKGID